MKQGLYELWLRWRAPLNTFWKRALYLFATLGALCALVVEFMLPILLDSEVSHELKDSLRPFYTFCFGISAAAKVTTAFPDLLKHKKEFNEKVEDHG